jgi:hypothetical protein
MIACVDFFVPAGDMRGLFAHFAQRDLKYEPAADHGSIGRGIMRPRCYGELGRAGTGAARAWRLLTGPSQDGNAGILPLLRTGVA